MSSEQMLAMVPGTTVAIDLPKHPRGVAFQCHQVWGGRVTLTCRSWDAKAHLVRLRMGERVEVLSGRTVILTLEPTAIDKALAWLTLDCPISKGRFRARMPRIRTAGVRVVTRDGLPVRR